MADSLVDLKPDRGLLDPHFDSYKLSLDALPVYTTNLDYDLDVVNLTSEQYSYQHMKAFGVHNHLFLDEHNTNTVYYVDQVWQLMSSTVMAESAVSAPKAAFQIPGGSNQRLAPKRHNVSLSFPAAEWAVLADGAGKLYLINTGNRSDEAAVWKVCFCEEVLGQNKPFVLLHCLERQDGESRRIECLLLHVEELEEDAQTDKSSFRTVLEWITLSAVEDEWSIERVRRLAGQATPDYAVIEKCGAFLSLASEKPFKMEYDSVKPVEEPKAATSGSGDGKSPPAYTWSQTMEDISVQFTIPASLSKSDIVYKLSHEKVELGLKNTGMLLEGALHVKVDIKGSTWILNNQRLELELSKVEPALWPGVVVGDSRGEMVVDASQLTEIHERLAHLTSATLNPDPERKESQAYNAQELEECDAFQDETAVFQRFDGESHLVTHTANTASHQWLFTAQLGQGHLPGVCLGHDVDGLLWQPKNLDAITEKESPWEHVGTFNALGYVQASKRQKKFASCAPNHAYAVLCDCVRHVYLYRQPAPVLSPLRNRKTGREVGAIAKQQLISLESVDNIMGVAATNERIFVMTSKVLHVIKVN